MIPPPFFCLAAFNLVEGIDVAAIEEKIAKYQEENAEQIMINRARKVRTSDNGFRLAQYIHICPL